MGLFDDIKQQLFSAVLCDSLDELGLTNQALRPFVRPLDEALTLVGRARTGLYLTTYSVREDENPYEVEIRLVDDLKPWEVPVLACNGPTERVAPWGELLSTAASMRGAVGCVTDGLVRDVRKIRALGFPVFHGGIAPLDSKGRGRMVEMDVTVQCGGVSVSSGDIIFGDADGVVVVPQQVESEILRIALDKTSRENSTGAELRAGMRLADVYEKYGVL